LVVACCAFLAVAAVAQTKPARGKAAGPVGSATKAEAAKPTVRATPRVELTASDGVVLVGTCRVPKLEGDAKAPGVLFLHPMRGKRQDWGSLLAELLRRGYALLAMDLRGHGESTKGKEGKVYDHRSFEPSEFPAMVGDAEAALAYLKGRPGVDSERIAIVGASIGANAALNAAAKDPAVKSLVLLSPGLEYHQIKTEPAMEQYGSRSVLLVASHEDSHSAQTVQTLEGLAKGRREVQMYGGAGHGTNMLGKTEGKLQTRILDWLDATLKAE